jgi:hypothetical protein
MGIQMAFAEFFFIITTVNLFLMKRSPISFMVDSARVETEKGEQQCGLYISVYGQR